MAQSKECLRLWSLITVNAIILQNPFECYTRTAGTLESEKLIPGMPVKAFIKTRERTVLSYLLKALSDYLE